MNRFLSQKFRFYSFVCIAALLFVHGYNLNETYLVPFSLVKERLTFTTFTEYFFANCILRFRIPMLFIISGYIFAMQDNKPYGERIKKRVVTLLIPYFMWSAIGLAITFLWQQYPITAEAVRSSQLDQLGDNRPYTEIGWGGILLRWLLNPPSFQLWFIRNLFIYNLLYPVLKWCVMRYTVTWFILVTFMWVAMLNFLFFEGMGILFFTLGVWLNKSNFPVDKKPEWFSRYICWLIFIGLSVIRTFMAFEFEYYNAYTMAAMMILHAASVAAGILAVWYSGNRVVRWCMNRKWFIWLTAFSFIIFALHIPLLAYVTRLFYMFGHNINGYRIFTYILAPTLVLFFCVGVGALLRRLVPRFYRLATGGRGF